MLLCYFFELGEKRANAFFPLSIPLSVNLGMDIALCLLIVFNTDGFKVIVMKKDDVAIILMKAGLRYTSRPLYLQYLVVLIMFTIVLKKIKLIVFICLSDLFLIAAFNKNTFTRNQSTRCVNNLECVIQNLFARYTGTYVGTILFLENVFTKLPDKNEVKRSSCFETINFFDFGFTHTILDT